MKAAQTKTDFDLIIIGGGPAGACAAAEAARSGVRTLLIERRELPRHKTCGGGIPLVAGELFEDFAPGSLIECRVERMRHTFRFREPHLGEINPPDSGKPLNLWMVQRSLFDHALVNRASRLGAVIRDGCPVRAIDADESCVRVVSDTPGGGTETVTARHLIGADGANGMTANSAGLRTNRVLAIATEIELPHRWGDGIAELDQHTAHLEYGVPRGYAWIFPKGDHLNIGAGVFRPRGDGGNSGLRDELRRAIGDYARMAGLPELPGDLKYHSHPLPIWNGREKLQTPGGTILLTGDAAGLINPFFGDGILHAMRSGMIAAQAVVEGTTASYTDLIHREFGPNFDAALRLAKFFYAFPALCFRHGATRPMATRTAARLLCGDLGFNEVAGRAIRRLRSAMAAG